MYIIYCLYNILYIILYSRLFFDKASYMATVPITFITTSNVTTTLIINKPLGYENP